jgi:hypothetical protein
MHKMITDSNRHELITNSNAHEIGQEKNTGITEPIKSAKTPEIQINEDGTRYSRLDMVSSNPRNLETERQELDPDNRITELGSEDAPPAAFELERGVVRVIRAGTVIRILISQR